MKLDHRARILGSICQTDFRVRSLVDILVARHFVWSDEVKSFASVKNSSSLVGDIRNILGGAESVRCVRMPRQEKDGRVRWLGLYWLRTDARRVAESALAIVETPEETRVRLEATAILHPNQEWVRMYEKFLETTWRFDRHTDAA